MQGLRHSHGREYRQYHPSNGIRPKPAHMICDIPGKPNVSKIYPPKRLKLVRWRVSIASRFETATSRLRSQIPNGGIRDPSASYPFRPTKSTFGAWAIVQWMDANRRKDVPGVVPKRKG